MLGIYLYLSVRSVYYSVNGQVCTLNDNISVFRAYEYLASVRVLNSVIYNVTVSLYVSLSGEYGIAYPESSLCKYRRRKVMRSIEYGLVSIIYHIVRNALAELVRIIRHIRS